MSQRAVLLFAAEADSSGGGSNRPQCTQSTAASDPYKRCCDEKTDYRHTPGEAEGATSVCRGSTQQLEHRLTCGLQNVVTGSCILRVSCSPLPHSAIKPLIQKIVQSCICKYLKIIFMKSVYHTYVIGGHRYNKSA